MNAFERIYDGICSIFAKVGKFLLILAMLYLCIGLACLLGFIVGGMILDYFSYDDFLGWLLWYVSFPLVFWFSVGVLYALIFLFLGSIGVTYQLLTGKELKGVL